MGKHSVQINFHKNRNCEICKRTKITSAPCRGRIDRVVPRAQKFGDLIAADHKIVSEGFEFRNKHRYAVVVQDLATQWIQSYPCKTKTSQETQRSLQKFLEPNRKPKVIYTDNSLEFGTACEDLSFSGDGRGDSPVACSRPSAIIVCGDSPSPNLFLPGPVLQMRVHPCGSEFQLSEFVFPSRSHLTCGTDDGRLRLSHHKFCST